MRAVMIYTVLAAFHIDNEAVCVHWVYLWCPNVLDCWMSAFVYFHLKKKTLMCASVSFYLLLRLSWVRWSLPVRSWQRMRKVGLPGSHSPPLQDFIPTWLIWMETCHRTVSTTSSAACRLKCRWCLCVCVLDLRLNADFSKWKKNNLHLENTGVRCGKIVFLMCTHKRWPSFYFHF